MSDDFRKVSSQGGGVSHDFLYLVFDPGRILVCYGGANDPPCRSHNLLDSPLFDVAEPNHTMMEDVIMDLGWSWALRDEMLLSHFRFCWMAVSSLKDLALLTVVP